MITSTAALAQETFLPIITQVDENTAGTQIVIDGVGFGRETAKVTLGSTSLSVVSSDDTAITAKLPSGIAAGTYLLTVENRRTDCVESLQRRWANKARKECKVQPDLPEHLAFPEHPALQEQLEPGVRPDPLVLPEYPVLPALPVQPALQAPSVHLGRPVHKVFLESPEQPVLLVPLGQPAQPALQDQLDQLDQLALPDRQARRVPPALSGPRVLPEQLAPLASLVRSALQEPQARPVPPDQQAPLGQLGRPDRPALPARWARTALSSPPTSRIQATPPVPTSISLPMQQPGLASTIPPSRARAISPSLRRPALSPRSMLE